METSLVFITGTLSKNTHTQPLLEKSNPDFTASESILLVDDELLMLRTAKKMLEKNGYNAFATAESKKAIEIYEENRDSIDIVILD